MRIEFVSQAFVATKWPLRPFDNELHGTKIVST
jgi:hypothetical protein